jgi:hypothetical protein
MVRGSSYSGFASACPASASDIRHYVLGIVPGGIDKSAVTVTSTCGSSPPSGPCSSPNDAPGNAVKVTVQYQFAFLFSFIGKNGIPMTGSSQMVIAR